MSSEANQIFDKPDTVQIKSIYREKTDLIDIPPNQNDSDLVDK